MDEVELDYKDMYEEALDMMKEMLANMVVLRRLLKEERAKNDS